MNRFEAAARERKTVLILSEILAQEARLKRSGAVFTRDSFINTMSKLSDEGWASVAVLAGCKPPSETTRKEILESLRIPMEGSEIT